ncbi:hypothetical protein JVT61DRAFT_5889 [Boletus reticuloceps]|uniref:Uncharacterized protein n=1 Tax=Boletus reticuloceps TaxID=495285 RepID=A0A8I2YM32_9AGAM|nr:hypothetical protein JVT61DRAFT_5889 [Boletus reticuloceps]
MSIRRKSTTHDLATLRLHPDGSRVQQSSVNARRRTARSTVIDARGNWIANDAGGKTSVKTRRGISSIRTDDAEGEFIDLSGDEEERSQSKGKQRACDSQIPHEDPLQEPESGRLNTRTRQRLSFMGDLSFLDPPPLSVSSLDQDTDHSDATFARESFVSFPDPAPDLLKSIHHFASCYYRERGQLSDSSRDYRGMKKERRRQSQENIHALAANTLNHQDINSETEGMETEDETTEEDEDESEVMDAEDNGKGHETKGDTYNKDMYKALDGSALMAIGICGTYTLIKTSHFRGTSKPETKKNRVAAP